MSQDPMHSYEATNIDVASPTRRTYTFCMQGLTPREELLFKGFVRLLDAMTECQWLYQETSPLHRVDLLVVHESVAPSVCQLPGIKPQPILRLGSRGTCRPFYLTLPIKPYELNNELDRLGRMMQSGLAPEVQAPAVLASGAPQQDPDPAAPQMMRLKQWPPARLLSEPGRLRLATLLTGKAMTMEELQKRAALAKSVCQGFIKDMQAASLLIYSAQDNHFSANMATNGHASGSAASPRAVATPAPKSAPTLGLLDRIRLRLGIKSQNRT